MTKINDIREMNDEQLLHELRETQQELFRLRFQASTEKLDAPSSLRKLRKTIARIKTVQQQRVLSASSTSES